jgi:hypothetical protein
LIDDKYVTPGLLLGGKVRAWRREEIMNIVANGVQRRPRGRRALAREAQRSAVEAATTNP